MSVAEWVSLAEAARRLGVDRHTLYDAADRGEVPARRIGRSVRVPLAWVEGADLARAWVESENHPFLNGRTALDVERFATELAAAVATELARLLAEAARAAALGAGRGRRVPGGDRRGPLARPVGTRAGHRHPPGRAAGAALDGHRLGHPHGQHRPPPGDGERRGGRGHPEVAAVDPRRQHRRPCRRRPAPLAARAVADTGRSEFVFTDELGEPVRPDRVNHLMRQAAKRAGVPNVGPHGMRHTAATLMLAAGLPLHVVSQRLGHADTSVTASLYAHVLKDQQTGAGDVMDRALYGGG